MLDREQALALLNELGPEKHLIQHALASEAVMRALARRGLLWQDSGQSAVRTGRRNKPGDCGLW